MNITFSPPMAPAALIFGGIAALALGLWLAWRGSGGLPRRARLALTAIRGLALLGAIALLANPGRWETTGPPEPSGWALLLDHSGSMAVADAPDGKTRWEIARTVADSLARASTRPAATELRLFADTLGPVWEPGRDLPLSPAGSRLDLAGLALLDSAAERAARWTGIVAIGDGRQTSDGAGLDLLAARARSLGIPFHTVAIGGPVSKRDLSVKIGRRQIVTLPSQSAAVSVRITNAGLPPSRATLRLIAPSGGPSPPPQSLEIPTGETAPAEFTLPPGAPAGNYRVVIDPPAPGDESPGNDAAGFHLRVLDKRIRVFMAEGAPYWDTKFLAQLLRGQELMDVEAVYRVRPERFYRVTTGENASLEESDAPFPESDAELGRYDLIVLGKGAEAFLTPERIDRLGRFVRDRGGALLFSRGKPYAGSFEGLETLELGNWGEETSAEYTLLPTADGAESGLFGERLPGPEHAVWRALPALEDVRTLAELKPFTRVLAAGERVGGGARVPLLVARRHGRGMVAAVNGDGLWRWSFNPGRKEGEEDWHREFWMQTLQWAATYSEFLPGEDYSLQLSTASVPAGGTARVRIGYRGAASPAPVPLITLTGSDGSEKIPAAESGAGEDGTPRWGAVLAPKAPGAHSVTLSAGGAAGPSLPLTVLPPPREDDERSADPDLLEKLSRETGGATWSADMIGGLLATLEPEIPTAAAADDAVWKPLWNHPWILAILALLLGVEWTARRRMGLL